MRHNQCLARAINIGLLTLSATALAVPVGAQQNKPNVAPIVIERQGSFMVGGSVVTAPGTFDPIKHGAYNPANPISSGQTLHGDHAYLFYQVPAQTRKLPLVFWHGHAESGQTWETTPDGREGFQNMVVAQQASLASFLQL